MESNKISTICLQMQDKLDPMGLTTLRNALEKMDDDKYDVVIASCAKLKDPTAVFLLSFFLGGFGVDRFVTGRVGSGVCKLIFGCLTLGIWWLVDVIKAKDKTREYNSLKIAKMLISM
ncbi:MAG: TM2 domain-containing protein [Bacteroidales bacterium]|nr:TM2 domain-containing protein [Bacteroidales bacterium]